MVTKNITRYNYYLTKKSFQTQNFYLMTTNKEILLPAQNMYGHCKIYLPVVLPASVSHHKNIQDHLLELAVQIFGVQDH